MNRSRLRGIVIANCVAVSLAIAVGCKGTENNMESALAYRNEKLDDTKLYWCINEINVSRIKRGMRKESLQELWGPSLRFENADRTARCILTVPKKSQEPVQLPPPWEIRFSLDERGTVEDFYLTRAVGK